MLSDYQCVRVSSSWVPGSSNNTAVVFACRPVTLCIVKNSFLRQSCLAGICLQSCFLYYQQSSLLPTHLLSQPLLQSSVTQESHFKKKQRHSSVKWMDNISVHLRGDDKAANTPSTLKNSLRALAKNPQHYRTTQYIQQQLTSADERTEGGCAGAF